MESDNIVLLRQLASFLATFVYVIYIGIVLWVMRMTSTPERRRNVQQAAFKRVSRFWHLHITVSGEAAAAPALLISNHCSYVDVCVLGTLGNIRFTPKKDVKSWPLIGWLVQMFDVIFVDRKPGAAKQAQQELMHALASGARVCVFPEGTTNDGRSLKPFKPSLFSLAEQWSDGQLSVQPVVVRYTAMDGQPMDDDAWEQIAWYGDASLFGHLWRFCSAKRIDVQVLQLPPLTLHAGDDRKKMAQHCYDLIAQQLGLLSLESDAKEKA